MSYYLSLFLAYMIGAFPTGVLISKYLLKSDIRNLGSGNPGTVNIYREFGLRWSATVAAIDITKGYLPVMYLPTLSSVPEERTFQILLGLFAVCGHIWSPWLKFGGGKGVATAFGVILAIAPISAVICVVIWILAAFLTKYAVIASLVSAGMFPVIESNSLEHASLDVWLLTLFPLLFLWTHRSNILRLVQGEELKIMRDN